MKKLANTDKFDSIGDIHRALGLPMPLHPLISLIDNSKNQIDSSKFPRYDVLKFYKIKFMTERGGRLRYGQGHYDFDEGSMLFAAPHQVIGSTEEEVSHPGYALLIHPDFFQGFPITAKVKQYGLFSY